MAGTTPMIHWHCCSSSAPGAVCRAAAAWKTASVEDSTITHRDNLLFHTFYTVVHVKIVLFNQE